MSNDFTAIPIVDIEGLRSGDAAARRRVAAELGHAARNVGFIYVVGHGVPDALFDGLLGAAKTFFAQPLEEKMKVYIGNSTNHRGYVPEGEEVFYGGTKDRKEAYDSSIDRPADDPDYVAGNPLIGPNQWPDLPGFKDAVKSYYTAAFEVGRTLLRGFALAMGEEEDLFEDRLTKPPSQLRLIHYPFNADAKDAMGIGAHTDYEMFTLLHATSTGLEVMNGAGVWIDAPPVPGAYVVNIGDMLELITNGAFIATSHRVRKVSEERYSFPLFFNLDYYAKVEPLPRFVTPENPARPGLYAGEHLFAQTAQIFTYMKARVAAGQVSLPKDHLGLSSFGQEARSRAPAE
jgi:isopenicillin N synthase-like dioxygenase